MIHRRWYSLSRAVTTWDYRSSGQYRLVYFRECIEHRYSGQVGSLQKPFFSPDAFGQCMIALTFSWVCFDWCFEKFDSKLCCWIALWSLLFFSVLSWWLLMCLWQIVFFFLVLYSNICKLCFEILQVVLKGNSRLNRWHPFWINMNRCQIISRSLTRVNFPSHNRYYRAVDIAVLSQRTGIRQ